MTNHGWRRAGGMLAAAAALAGCEALQLTPEPAAEASFDPGQALPAEARPLVPLFEQLYALETGARTEPVRIVQIGDNHTAGDEFSGRLRTLLQARFGAAGRGMLPPGLPFADFRPQLVTIEQSRGWEVASSINDEAGGLYGLSGYRLRGDSSRERVTLTSTEPGGFDRVGLSVVQQPGGGGLDVRVDGVPLHELSTDGDITRAARLDLAVPPGSRALELRARGDGPVDLIAWTFERDTPGVVYDSLGVAGAGSDVMDAWDAPTVAWELAARQPALLVVAYGTNEALDGAPLAGYAEAFAARLDMLSAAAPGAAILVVGPPDVNEVSPACGRRRRSVDQCLPPEAAASSCAWQPPAVLEPVREAQRQVVEAQGGYFWDWSEVMGGPCGMHGWATETPPLALDDHVHLTPAGYDTSADALLDELMTHYAQYRAAAAAGPVAPAALEAAPEETAPAGTPVEGPEPATEPGPPVSRSPSLLGLPRQIQQDLLRVQEEILRLSRGGAAAPASSGTEAPAPAPTGEPASAPEPAQTPAPGA